MAEAQAEAQAKARAAAHVPARRGSATNKKDAAAAVAAAEAASKTAAAEQLEARKPLPEPAKEEKSPENEDPVLAIRSMLLDRLTVHLLALLLPAAQNIKVLLFSDCRLDVEMLRLLKDGLTSTCSLEALQVEWNPLEVPLPTVEELEVEAAAKAADAAAAAAASDGISATLPETSEGEATTFDLEFRERSRYRMQSQRTLQAFRERVADLFDGSLAAAFEALKAAGDADALLNSSEFQSVVETCLDVSWLQVVSTFEVLDGPDYAGGGGLVSLSSLQQALESLPENVVREGVVDPVGVALAAFVDPSSVLESLSFRACNIGRVELAVIGESLKQCPWNLRILNLWDNYLCDRCASLLASAVEEYRGFEYIGLGRNRITDAGLATLCAPFNLQVLDESTLKEKQELVKGQQEKLDADAKAKAKAKAAPAPTEGRHREAPQFTDELKEFPPEEGSSEPSVWVFKRYHELKILNLSENPIKDVKALEELQLYGPPLAELVLRGCPVARKDIASRRRGSGIAGIGSMDAGWVLRMV
jgi:hypothetical protein